MVMDQPPPSGQTLLQTMKNRHQVINAAISQVIDTAAAEQRGFLQSEERAFAKAKTVRAAIEERIGELTENERREEAAAATARLVGPPPGTPGNGLLGGYTNSTTYARGDSSKSFFKDLRNARQGDWNAIERLRANNAEVRALGNTGSTGGSGGEFAPPGWFTADFIKLARAGRVTADLMHKAPLPPGISSVNLPRVASGTSAGVQSTQNTALSSTDMTTAAVSSGITTIGGTQVVSLQLVEQSGIPFDEVVLGDLSADYARQLDQQVISGTGTGGTLRGLLSITGGTNVTYTQATPSAVGPGGLYSKLGQLVESLHTSRFLPMTAWIMHPRRWSALSVAMDSQNRPLITPSGAGVNSIATQDQVVAQGMAGNLFGIPVFLDPNLSTTRGASGTEDVIIGLRSDDCWLWESPLQAEAFDAPYANSMGLLLRVYAYAAFIPDRYPASVGTITGTGLVAPTWT